MATPSNGTQTPTIAASDIGDTFAIVDVTPWYLGELVDAWARRLHARNAYNVFGHAAVVTDVVYLHDIDQAIVSMLGEPEAVEELLELREERRGLVNQVLAIMFALEHEADLWQQC